MQVCLRKKDYRDVLKMLLKDDENFFSTMFRRKDIFPKPRSSEISTECDPRSDADEPLPCSSNSNTEEFQKSPSPSEIPQNPAVQINHNIEGSPKQKQGKDGSSPADNSSSEEGSSIYSTPPLKVRKTRIRRKKKTRNQQNFQKKRKKPRRNDMFVGSPGPQPRRADADPEERPRWSCNYKQTKEKERTTVCTGSWRSKPPFPVTTSIFHFKCMRWKLI